MAGSFYSVLIAAWLAGVAALIGYRLLSGDIRTDGLLGDGDGPTPERVQMLIATLITVGGYLVTVLDARAEAAQALTALPDPPTSLIVIFGGGQALYLAGKLTRKAQNGVGGTQ